MRKLFAVITLMFAGMVVAEAANWGMTPECEGTPTGCGTVR